MLNLSYPARKYLCQTSPPHHFGSKGLGLGHGLDIVFAVFLGQFPLTIPLSGGEMNGKLTWKPGISYMYGRNLHYALRLS